MIMYFLAIVLVGVAGVGESAPAKSAANGTAEKLPPPATAGDLQLEKAARDFRIQTYEAFRNNRPEYDRRSAEAFKLQKAWADAGSNPDDQAKLTQWFAQATAHAPTATQGARDEGRGARTATGAVAELPAAPTFVARPPKDEDEDDKSLVDANDDNPMSDDSKARDDRLHVKPAASSTTATAAAKQDAKPTAKAAANGVLPAAKKSAVSPSDHSAIGSLPNAFGAEISRVLDGLSKRAPPAKSTPAADKQRGPK